MPDWIVLLPPLAAILFAITFKKVIPSLLLGLWLSEMLLREINPLLGAVGIFQRCLAVLNDISNVFIILFSLLVGVLLALFRESKGAEQFVANLSTTKWANSRRSAALLPSFTGILIFIETNLSILTAGLLGRRLFDRFKMSRAQLAYILDATCAPVSVLIVLNGWGAYILGLLRESGVDGDVLGILLKSIPYNFYPILAILIGLHMAWSGKTFGPMRKALPEQNEEAAQMQPYQIHILHTEKSGKARYMLIPLSVLVFGTLSLMWYTGEGSLIRGASAFSIFVAVIAAIFTALLLLIKDKVFSLKQLAKISKMGLRELFPMVLILLFSFAFGSSIRLLGTDVFIAEMARLYLDPAFVAPLLFITACLISFTTGTSWGTFAIMIPIGMTVAVDLNIALPLALASILGGAVFGDHASPISDTSVMSSLASGCDHMEHVRTQLPYALFAAGITFVIYLVMGCCR